MKIKLTKREKFILSKIAEAKVLLVDNFPNYENENNIDFAVNYCSIRELFYNYYKELVENGKESVESILKGSITFLNKNEKDFITNKLLK